MENQSIETIFKNNLKKLRTDAKLTKSEAADNIGITRGYYHTLENNSKHKTPSFHTLERISAYYHIAVKELFNEP